MKKIILVLALAAPFTVTAQPSTQIAWTAEQLNFVKAGNSQKGKELAQTCTGCHGASGISTTGNTPSLAGQLATYIYKQLQDYKEGNRDNIIMSGLAKTLSKQDAADLANWYASLPPAFQSGSKVKYDNAEKLVKNGDKERIIPPCEVCHGGNGKGQKLDIPALSAQNAEYFSATLKEFKEGSRHNDIYSRMRLIAETLSAEEIIELGMYYQNMKE